MTRTLLLFTLFLASVSGELSLGQTVPVVSLRLEPTPYEMARPATWVQSRLSGSDIVTAWQHPEAPLFPNLNVTLEPLNPAGEAGVEALMKKLKSQLPNFQLADSQWVERGDVRGFRSTSSWTSMFGELTAMRLLIPWQDKVLVITLVDFSQTFPLNQPVFEKCLDAVALFEEKKLK